MNDDVRELVSAMLAIAYAAVILVVGELYIVNRSTKLSTIVVTQQPDHATPAARRSP
jgi:hypothetical protein